MPTIDTSSCPRCAAAPGTLRLATILQARPVGDFSLAGVMMKFPARERVRLTCTACPLDLVGDYDEDGRHVTFSAPNGLDRT